MSKNHHLNRIMYRRPKFLEVLDAVRLEMSREADYDVDLFAEMVRQEKKAKGSRKKKELCENEFNPQNDLIHEIKK